MTPCGFTFSHYEESLKLAKEQGYFFSTLADFKVNKDKNPLIILRHDVDYSEMPRALSFAEIENKLGIKATYFIRVHCDEYNPFGFKTYQAIRHILNLGHEIGLHYEHLDFCDITKEDPAIIITKEKQILELIFDVKVKGIAAHIGWADIINWSFWAGQHFTDFDFEYDAYQDTIMNNMLYADDSLRHWKEDKCMCWYIKNQVPRLYFLTHGYYWYHESFYLE